VPPIQVQHEELVQHPIVAGFDTAAGRLIAQQNRQQLPSLQTTRWQRNDECAVLIGRPQPQTRTILGLRTDETSIIRAFRLHTGEADPVVSPTPKLYPEIGSWRHLTG
jgi:hypothetical protein